MIDTKGLPKEQRIAIADALEPDRAQKGVVATTTTRDENGKIVKEERTQIGGLTKSEEPDYIKLYYSTILAFQGIKDIPVEVLIAISHHVDYANKENSMIFRSDVMTRESMCEELGVKDEMCRKYLQRARKAGLLISTKHRGIYMINPYMLARGSWKDIKALRAQVDFKSGTWSTEVEYAEDAVDPDTGEIK